MKLTIEINMDSAAFEDHPRGVFGEALDIVTRRLIRVGNEADLLRNTGCKLDDQMPLFDANGNQVGKMELTP